MSEVRSAVAGRDVERDGWPAVSVVLPIRNEGPHLDRAVASVLAQEYPCEFDVYLAVAPSDDGTEAIAAALADRDERVHVVPNPAGITPAGLNAAITASTGEIVVRVDGHAELSPGYIRRAVETMIRTSAVNVGGRQVPQPTTPFEESVAAATTSVIGTGGARYRVGGEEGPVDTVYLGVFDRAAGDAVGWFDESLIRNQDYELNIRLRAAGGTIWFDPELWVGYRPRSSLGALARQYFEYGWWKADVARRHPDSLKLRQLVPLGLLASLGLPVVGGPRGAVPLAGYVALVTASAARARGPLLLAVLPTIHLSWATGFVSQALRTVTGRDRRHG